jgi:hypothetical protein
MLVAEINSHSFFEKKLRLDDKSKLLLLLLGGSSCQINSIFLIGFSCLPAFQVSEVVLLELFKKMKIKMVIITLAYWGRGF